MKHGSQKALWLFPFVAAFFLLSGQSQARTPAPGQPTSPYYVQYQPGLKAEVTAQITAAGGKIVDDLTPLPVLVAMLPDQKNSPLSAGSAVLRSEPVPHYHLDSEVYPSGLDSGQALDIWDFDRDQALDPDAPTGSGLTVCVIDTGLQPNHKDLTGTTIAGESQISGEDWDNDVYGHGTHVTGSIAANLQGLGLAGYAPQVEIYMVKMFDNTGHEVLGESNLGSAALTCLDQGADIINMSLSGDYSAIEKLIFDYLYDQGILIVGSAGNNGGTSGTEDDLAYPSSYPAVISTAAVSSALSHASFSNENDEVELAAEGVAIVSTSPLPDNGGVPWASADTSDQSIAGFPLLLSSSGTATANLVSGGLCLAPDASWANHIVLCERGGGTFRVKVNNSENSGSLGTIIYNNQPGLFAGNLVSGTSNGPAISIPQAEGQDLLANYLNTAVTVSADNGENSLAGIGGYKILDGTSMSAAYVSGAAALVWSACPGLTNAQLRQLLRDTAVDLGSPGWDMSFGYGLVQAFNAIQTCRPSDLGDLDRVYGQAAHTGDGALRLGANWQANTWQLSYPGADYDDLNDDGLAFSSITPGDPATVDVTPSGEGASGWVRGWMDFNRDNHFAADELIVDAAVPVGPTTQFNFNVPSTVISNVRLNYRFRLYPSGPVNVLDSTAAPFDPQGLAQGGEVEDGFVTPDTPTAITFQGLAVQKVQPLALNLFFIFGALILAGTISLLRKTARKKSDH